MIGLFCIIFYKLVLLLSNVASFLFKQLAFITNKLDIIESEITTAEFYLVSNLLNNGSVNGYGFVLPNGIDITGKLTNDDYFSLFVLPENMSWELRQNTTVYPNIMEDKTDISQEQVDLLESLIDKNIFAEDCVDEMGYHFAIGETRLNIFFFGAADEALSKEEEGWLEDNKELIEHELYQTIKREHICFILTLCKTDTTQINKHTERVEYIVRNSKITKIAYTKRKKTNPRSKKTQAQQSLV
tara:strand:+ start:116779 stop:117507 length:729 start_codon:yes stop_codon:yes gene_type:complete